MVSKGGKGRFGFRGFHSQSAAARARGAPEMGGRAFRAKRAQLEAQGIQTKIIGGKLYVVGVSGGGTGQSFATKPILYSEFEKSGQVEKIKSVSVKEKEVSSQVRGQQPTQQTKTSDKFFVSAPKDPLTRALQPIVGTKLAEPGQVVYSERGKVVGELQDTSFFPKKGLPKEFIFLGTPGAFGGGVETGASNFFKRFTRTETKVSTGARQVPITVEKDGLIRTEIGAESRVITQTFFKGKPGDIQRGISRRTGGSSLGTLKQTEVTVPSRTTLITTKQPIISIQYDDAPISLETREAVFKTDLARRGVQEIEATGFGKSVTESLSKQGELLGSKTRGASVLVTPDKSTESIFGQAAITRFRDAAGSLTETRGAFITGDLNLGKTKSFMYNPKIPTSTSSTPTFGTGIKRTTSDFGDLSKLTASTESAVKSFAAQTPFKPLGVSKTSGGIVTSAPKGITQPRTETAFTPTSTASFIGTRTRTPTSVAIARARTRDRLELDKPQSSLLAGTKGITAVGTKLGTRLVTPTTIDTPTTTKIIPKQTGQSFITARTGFGGRGFAPFEFPPLLPGLPGGGAGTGFGLGRASKSKKGFKPTIFTATRGITSPRISKFGIRTGLGIRPVVKKKRRKR